jgi:single-stranded-DNA-specific exonuclease
VNKRWIIAAPDPEVTAKLAHKLQLEPALAQTLVNRGYRDTDAARRFLNPQLRQLTDPLALPDMSAAVDRIVTGGRIVIYGDYDVDGVTASALLYRVLTAAGADVRCFLPHRMDEGYGLTADGLKRCLKEHRPELLIAVDCGTNAVAEIAGLKAQGIDVIVLDHHEPPAELPACVALVNPKSVARASSPFPNEQTNGLEARAAPLASVGVAFKLAHALLKRDRGLADRVDLREHLDLVALGTIADMVPLTGENRILARAGLDRMGQTKKAGLRALMDVAAVPDDVTPYHVGFRIGPRLNAAGRLADAMAALELMLTEDADRARELAEVLHQHNADRQRIEEKIVVAALAQAAALAKDRVLVLANDEWHVGVIGIVASRVLQEYYRPVVVIGAGGKGSCRSIAGFSMVAALTACAPLLERFGGHEMAAGLTVATGNVGKLRQALNDYAGRVLRAEDLVSSVRVDAVVGLGDLDAEFLAQLRQFEPCGMDNPAPVLAVENVRLRGTPRVVGKKHLKFFVTDGDAVVEAVWWGKGDAQLPAGALDVAFVPELNDYRGVESVVLRVRDARASGRSA